MALKGPGRLGMVGLTGALIVWLSLSLPDRGDGASVHEIPSDVTIQAIIKPEGNRLLVLVRAP
ncbi:MAG: hypothetical protein IIA44_13265, partial [Acidobacteria bacterium]|nr:hypothetical protein [Acidobacteriota bacterium]